MGEHMGMDEMDEASIAHVRSELTRDVLADQRAIRRSRTRRIGFVSAAGVAALALVGGAIAVTQASQTEIEGTIRCFAVMDGDAEYTTVIEASADGDVPDTAFSKRAIEVCGAMYRVGILGDGKVLAPKDPSKVDYPIPELVTCTLRDGVIGVFPNENTTDTETCYLLGYTQAS